MSIPPRYLWCLAVAMRKSHPLRRGSGGARRGGSRAHITITAPASGIAEGPLTFPGTPPVTDRRGAFAGELARAHSELEQARAQVAEREREIERLRTAQITDGSDPRLIDFWEKAGRIADHADFCQEYDRLAEAMNGTPRCRDWEVEAEVTVTVCPPTKDLKRSSPARTSSSCTPQARAGRQLLLRLLTGGGEDLLDPASWSKSRAPSSPRPTRSSVRATAPSPHHRTAPRTGWSITRRASQDLDGIGSMNAQRFTFQDGAPSLGQSVGAAPQTVPPPGPEMRPGLAIGGPEPWAPARCCHGQ